MSQQCERVYEGDLITAKFMNECVLNRLTSIENALAKVEAKLQEVTSSVGDKIGVPNVIGMNYATAKNTIEQSGLKIGTLRSESGQVITQVESSAVVKEQLPGAGTEVAAGTSVDLRFKGTATEPTGPTITFSPSQVHVGDSVFIEGRHMQVPQGLKWSGSMPDITVKVGSVSAAITDLSELKQQITIKVPSVAPGKHKIFVKITFSGSSTTVASSDYLTVLGTKDTASPFIKDIKVITEQYENIITDPGGPVERYRINPGDLVTIEGGNFAVNPADNYVTVKIDNREIELPVVSVSQDGTMVQVQAPETMSIISAGSKEATFTVSKQLDAGKIYADAKATVAVKQ